MNIFEMSFIQGLNDTTSYLYFNNDETSRTNFINSIQQDIKNELESYIANQKDHELIHFYNEIYLESFNYLSKIKDKFIEDGYSEIIPGYILKVQKRSIQDH